MLFPYVFLNCLPFPQIRIDKLVDKWSGSIEIGVTTHNPNNLDYPATMTNLRSGTVPILLALTSDKEVLFPGWIVFLSVSRVPQKKKKNVCAPIFMKIGRGVFDT